MKINLKKFTTHILTALVASFGLSAANAQDNVWTGTTSTDWNTAGNWSLTNVPTGQNAIVNNTSGNTATISANISVTPNDIIVRNGSRIDHLAGTAGTGGGSWMWVENGVYNLANTASAGGISGFAQGTGSLSATGNLLVGAWGDDRIATMNVNTTGTFAVSGELFFGDSARSRGALNLESGTMTVNNKIFIGNNQGTGTVTMSGGSLTKTAGEDTFVGRDNGIGTLTQSGGTVTLNHNLYVGQGGGGNGTINLSGSAVLNTGRDFVIGREGGTGSLNVTGGTITKTGDEKMIVGHNNGVGTVVHSGGTINVNQNQLYIGNGSTNTSGTYTLSGTGALNVANELIVGRESGTGVLNVNGGTITTSGNGNMYVGRFNGTGALNQTGGTIVVNKEFGVGTRDGNQGGIGAYNLSGGSIAVANNFFVGKEQGASGTMTMTGGTLGTSESLRIGHNQATGVLTQSGGTVNVQNEVYIGNENSGSSVGTYTLSGTGAVNVGNEVHIGRDNATGTLNLNGGTLMTKKLEGGTGSATVNFNGGVLKAKENQDNLIQNLDVANVQSGGAKINSNGFNVATSQALTGTGGLEKLGAGSLTLSANNTYAGTTTVSEGLLKVNGSVGSVTVSSGGSLGGSGTVGSLSLSSGSFLTPGNSPGTLTASSATISGGSTYNWQITSLIGSAGTNWDLLNVTGEMNLSDISSSNKWNLVITADGAFTGWTGGYYDYVFAQAASTTGFSAAAGTDVTDLFNITSSGITSFPETNVVDSFRVVVGSAGGLTNFTLKAVPEPSSAALTLLGLVSTLALARRRR
ncbi:MAG: autotransporter-associated beta strand repeat-containing protein [Candidatus Pacebacteria bacterium]|nr:autotransporter-associated beta strand repeat-containing protein [Candidatus Paceibacterota bacterium]